MAQVHKHPPSFLKPAVLIPDKLNALGNGSVSDLSVGEIILLETALAHPFHLALHLSLLAGDVSGDPVKYFLTLLNVQSLFGGELGLKF